MRCHCEFQVWSVVYLIHNSAVFPQISRVTWQFCIITRLENAQNVKKILIGWTHWGLVTPYGNRDLGQHWPRQWLVAWWHQAITWTNVDLSSVEFCGIHLTTILLVAFKASIHEMSSKIIFLKLQPHLPGANELTIDDWKFIWWHDQVRSALWLLMLYFLKH